MLSPSQRQNQWSTWAAVTSLASQEWESHYSPDAKSWLPHTEMRDLDPVFCFCYLFVLFEDFEEGTMILYKWVMFNDRSIFGCKLNGTAFRT